MKGRRGFCVRLLLWSLVLLLAAPPGGVMAQGLSSSGQTIFRQEELDQMLAPIALYPDELLVQVLMAATYPLEVVQAARWVQAYPNLKGDQLAAALEQQNWDPSVKSLVNFPSLLQMMNDRLEWMQMLGDAFLAQEEQVMDTVQQLRWRAQAQGSLRTTSEQTVIVDPQSQEIIIEPAAPQIVYVPVYDPMIVYGPWWWPAYRPYYYHPRGVVIRPGIVGFGLGVAVGAAWGYAWGGFNWHHHDVVINVQRNVYINNHIDRNRYESHVTTGGGGQGTWRHDPVHRQGVAYRAPAVAQQYGRGPGPGADARRDFRGFDHGTTGKVVQGPGVPAMQQPRPAPAPQVRPEPPRQPAGPVQQPRVAPSPPIARPEPPRQPAGPAVQQPQQQPRPAPSAPQASPGRAGVQGVQGPPAFGGASPGSQTRQFSNRGHESLGSAPAGGQAPGGNRASPGVASPGGAPQGGGSPGNPQGGGSRGNPHGGR
jgi:hypothetical protein